MPNSIVITGIGMVTPLGNNPAEVLRRITTGDCAAAPPDHFDASPFACPVCAQVRDFHPQAYVSEVKMARLMNRDAQLAVAAAHLAMQDAGIKAGDYYRPEEIGLYGATGLAGLPLQEVAPLLKASTTSEGRFDLGRFGVAGLRAVSPILSFKILGNMPVCFVSICENIQGPNAIYTPWEGQGAQAIEAGIHALQYGDARWVVTGGCDVKTHELAFITLAQLGLFDSWHENNTGLVPGEGATFLVLETEEEARERGARCHARLADWSLVSHQTDNDRANTCAAALNHLVERRVARAETMPGAIIAAGNGDPTWEQSEAAALSAAGLTSPRILFPKKQAGDSFAAAAPLQIALGALLAHELRKPVLANCFGHGSEQAAFLLEQP